MRKSIHKNMKHCEKCGTPFWEKLCYTCQIKQLEAENKRLKEEAAQLRAVGQNIICGDHWSGLEGEMIDGNTGCPWCLIEDLTGDCQTHADVNEQLQDENEQLQAELEKHRWIPVTERLPENIATVWILLYAKATEFLCPNKGFYGEDENGWGWKILGDGLLTKVTYWKPIILPKEQ